jgi:hypothetical protein
MIIPKVSTPTVEFQSQHLLDEERKESRIRAKRGNRLLWEKLHTWADYCGKYHGWQAVFWFCDSTMSGCHSRCDEINKSTSNEKGYHGTDKAGHRKES